MKRLLSILGIAAMLVMASCIKDDPGECNGIDGGGTAAVKEIEIAISTGASDGGTGTRGIPASRAELDGKEEDPGIVRENYIATLDLLIFEHSTDGSGRFLYRAEAVKRSGNAALTESVYRAKLREYDGAMDVHLIANSRNLLGFLDGVEVDDGRTWAWVHERLVDKKNTGADPPAPGPARLMDDAFAWIAIDGSSRAKGLPLPMYGRMTNKSITDAVPSNWGKVDMIRSVASFDVFQQLPASDPDKNFDLLCFMVAHAAEVGYIGELLPTDGTNNAEITTRLHSSLPAELDVNLQLGSGSMVAWGSGPVYKDDGYFACSYQTYVYENPYTGADDAAKRRTRIIAGVRYYGNPDKYYYYPIDVARRVEDAQGNVISTIPIPVERNHKYEFIITAVTGPGYDNFEEAKTGVMRNINVDVVAWDKSQVAIGRWDRYYAAMEDKLVTLERHAGDTEKTTLTYSVWDGVEGTVLMKFKGAEGDPGAGPIGNGFFEVTLNQSASKLNGEAVFTVKALTGLEQRNPATDMANYSATVEVTFRDLTFEFDIQQTDGTEWENGGDIEVGEESYKLSLGTLPVFQPGSDDYLLDLTCNSAWSVVSEPAWAHVMAQQNFGSKSVHIYVPDIATGHAREGEIVFQVDADPSVRASITVRQKARVNMTFQIGDVETPLSDNPTVHTSSESNNIRFAITGVAIDDFSVVHDYTTDDGITVLPPSNLIDQWVDLEANTGSVSRTFVLTFDCGPINGQQTVTIVQAARFGMSAETVTFGPNAAAPAQTVTLAAEGDWELNENNIPDWFSVSPTSGTGNALLTFTLNSTDDDGDGYPDGTNYGGSRNTTLIIACGTQEAEIEVVQQGGLVVDWMNYELNDYVPFVGSPNVVNIPAEGGYMNLYLGDGITFGDLDIYSWDNEEGITPNDYDGSDTMEVEVSENETGYERRRTLTMSKEVDGVVMTTTVTIVQAAQP